MKTRRFAARFFLTKRQFPNQLIRKKRIGDSKIPNQLSDSFMIRGDSIQNMYGTIGNYKKLTATKATMFGLSC